MLDEQLITMGVCVTVTLKEQLVLPPQLSLAKQFTDVVPIGNVEPLGGLHVKLGGLHPPLSVALKNTVAPFGLVAAVVMFDEQFNTMAGGGFTVTWKEQLVF